MLMSPVDLAAPTAVTPDRWVVVFGDRMQFEAYIRQPPNLSLQGTSNGIAVLGCRLIRLHRCPRVAGP